MRDGQARAALPRRDPRVKDATELPVAAYNVSGEYAMVKAAAAAGHLDERAAVLETLTGIRRAGADIVITYHAKDVATWLSSPPQGAAQPQGRRGRSRSTTLDKRLLNLMQGSFPLDRAAVRARRASWPGSPRTR